MGTIIQSIIPYPRSHIHSLAFYLFTKNTHTHKNNNNTYSSLKKVAQKSQPILTLDSSSGSCTPLYIMRAPLNPKMCELQSQVICAPSPDSEHSVVQQRHINLNKHCIRGGEWKAPNNRSIENLKLFQR